MNTRKLPIGLAVFALVGGVGAWGFAQSAQPPKPADQNQPKDREEDGDEEQAITLDKAPDAVRAAAIKLASDAKNITKVTREEDEEDVVTYEVEYNDAATKCSAVFSTAGDLMEQEKSTTEAKLPAAVMEALKKEYPKATFTDPQAVTKMYYEIVVVIDGKKHEIKVNGAGGIDDEQDEKDEKGRGEKHEKDEKHEGR